MGFGGYVVYDQLLLKVACPHAWTNQSKLGAAKYPFQKLMKLQACGFSDILK